MLARTVTTQWKDRHRTARSSVNGVISPGPKVVDNNAND